MAELSLGMILDIVLNLLPVAFVIPDFLTGTANRQQPAQALDMGERRFQLSDQSFPLFSSPYLIGDIL